MDYNKLLGEIESRDRIIYVISTIAIIAVCIWMAVKLIKCIKMIIFGGKTSVVDEPSRTIAGESCCVEMEEATNPYYNFKNGKSTKYHIVIDTTDSIYNKPRSFEANRYQKFINQKLMSYLEPENMVDCSYMFECLNGLDICKTLDRPDVKSCVEVCDRESKFYT